MGVAAVRERVPALEPQLGAAASSAASPLGLEVFEAGGQEVLGLSPCRARFYFANDQLYKIGFDCDEDEALFTVLKERFGPATQKVGENVHWLSDTRAVSVNPATRRFSFSDRERDRIVQLAIYQTARRDAPSANTGPSAAAPREHAASRAAGAAFDWFGAQERLDRQLDRLARAQGRQEIVDALLGLTVIDARVVPRVAPLLRHPETLVFEAAAANLEDVALAATPEAQRAAVEALGAVLADGEAPPERKLRIIEAFMLLREKDGVPRELARALEDPEREVRREAVMTLALTHDAVAIEALARARSAETDGPMRELLDRALEVAAMQPRRES